MGPNYSPGFQSIYNDPNLQNAKAQATSAQQNALSSEVAGMQLPDMLRQALTSKFTEANPMIGELGNARADVMNSFTSAPLSVLPENNNGMIFSPTQQADLIQRQRSAPIARLSTLNDLFGLNVGGIQNVIDSTGRAFGAQTTAAQGKSTIAQNALQQLLTELSQRAQEKEAYESRQIQLQQLKQNQEKEKRDEEMAKTKLAEEIRQYNETLKLEYAKVNKSGSEGLSKDQIERLLFGNSGGTTTPAKAIDPNQFIVQDKKSTAQQNLLKGVNLTSAWGGTGYTPTGAKNPTQPKSGLTMPLNWDQIFK